MLFLDFAVILYFRKSYGEFILVERKKPWKGVIRGAQRDCDSDNSIKKRNPSLFTNPFLMVNGGGLFVS